MVRYRLLLVLLAIIPAYTADADMIDTSGMKPWETCALCHGLDGISRMAKFPKLAGQPYNYLVKQLQDFRTAHRSNDGGMMASNAELLTYDDLEAVARYFSALPPPVPNGTGNALGKELFTAGKPTAGVPACATCHGRNAPDGGPYPRLEAQHADYVAKQLRDFRQHNRNNDRDAVMRQIARKLTQEEIDAIAAYVAASVRK